jgi:hypothetical protein
VVIKVHELIFTIALLIKLAMLNLTVPFLLYCTVLHCPVLSCSVLFCSIELAISRLNLPTDLSLDCHTGHVLIRCATPFGAQKSLSPEAIAAEILCALKKYAEEYLKRRPIKDANNGGE